ncbi:MAG: DUF3604 domain-containing protein [Sandaracinaceae bacterium]
MPLTVSHRPDRYLRSPWLRPTADGATLFVLGWDGRATETLWAFALDPTGAPLGDGRPLRSAPRLPVLVRDADAEVPAVTEDPALVDVARADGHEVRVARGGGHSSVLLEGPGGRVTVVWSARATAAAPAVAVVPGRGVWVAFHHNLREDSGRPDLAKWIALRWVATDGSVHRPAAAMTGRDRDREGEEQSFELPSLAVGPGGAVRLFGRGSHAHFRQDLDDGGFRPRVRLGTGDWGCRGRWVACAPLPDGRLVTARREREGVELLVLDAPAGGPPALTPCRVDHPAAPHLDLPAHAPGGADPAAEDGRRTLFGDIHQHSAHSDGIGTADEPYLRARFVYGDDFAALTDHESFLGKRIGPGEWAYLTAVADRHDEPGRFATLHAFEWTGRRYPGPGHKVVYLPSGGAVVSRDEVPDGGALLTAVVAQGGFAVPHHVGWTGADEDAHRPDAQPVWEICSCHGCYLYADHPLGARGDLRDQMVEEVLRRGHRFGFIACSDGHGLLFHHGVGRKRDPFRCGLTAVQARACTREAILEAIRERRCYATSGAKILLDLRARLATGEVVPMGGEVPWESVELMATVRAPSPVASLALVGPAGALATAGGEGREDLVVRARADGVPWVYARAVCEDGERAWSSPIFAGAAPEAPP